MVASQTLTLRGSPRWQPAAHWSRFTAGEDLRRYELDRFSVGALRKLLQHPAPVNVKLAPVTEEPPSVQEITLAVRVQPPLDSKVLELMQMHVRAQDGRGLHVTPVRSSSVVVILWMQSVLRQ